MNKQDKCETEETLVSVYLLTYNRAEFLKDAIGSILDQKYKRFVLYILDNCSTDNTQCVVKSFSDKRIHYIRHKTNIGAIGNGNFAITHCRTKYFVLFHDDDLMLPDFLEKEINVFISQPQIDAVAGNAIYFGEGKEIIAKGKKHTKFTLYANGELFNSYLESGNYLICPSIMYRTEFVKKNCIKVNNEAGPCSDVISYFDIERLGGKIIELNEVIMKYRHHGNQDSVLHKYEMHIVLFNYLRTNKNYFEMYCTNQKGRESRHKYFSRQIFIDTLQDTISPEEAKKYMIQFSEELEINKINIWLLIEKLCLKSRRIKNLFMFLYIRLKKLRN